MKYKKKQFSEKDNDMTISFWSTDDNIMCENEKTLRENLNNNNWIHLNFSYDDAKLMKKTLNLLLIV